SRSAPVMRKENGGREPCPAAARNPSFSERDPDADLELPRVAGAFLHRAVEIEHEIGYRGLLGVLGVEEVEPLDRRLDQETRHVEFPREAQVERGILVVLAP